MKGTASLSTTPTHAVAWRAYAALGVGVVCIAWSAIFVKWAGVPGPASAFYRVAIAALVLGPWWLWRHPAQLARRSLRLSVVAGICFGLDLLLWNTAILLTTAGTATLLGSSAPVWVGVLTVVLFRERLALNFWLGMLVALIGAALIVGGDAVRQPQLGWGSLLAMSAGIAYAGYLITTQRVRRETDTLTSLTLVVVVSSVALGVLCVALNIPLTGYSAQAWLALVGLGLVSQVGGWLAINYALGHLPATITSVSLLIQPVLTALFAIPLLHEYLRPEHILGGVLVLAGVYVVHRRRSA